MKVKTLRKIRAYKADGNNLVPIGGFKKGKTVNARVKQLRKFSNAKFPAVEVIGLKNVSGKVYILLNPKNFSPIHADGVNHDCETSAFKKFRYISADAATALDFGTEESFENDNGDWNNDSEFPAEFNAEGDYEGADGLTDDTYCCAEGDTEEKTIEEIQKMSKKERKKYKRALRLKNKQSKALGKSADAALNKSLAKAAGDTSTPTAGAAAAAPPSGDGKILGLPKVAVIGGGAVALLLVVGVILMATSKKKQSGGGAGAAASAK